MSDYLEVVTTVERLEDAEKLAKGLVDERLAACVQILGPVKSVYRWKGRLEEAEEWLCLIKTRSSLYREVEGFLKDRHPYEVPEILAFPITEGDKAYLRWMDEELKHPG